MGSATASEIPRQRLRLVVESGVNLASLYRAQHGCAGTGPDVGVPPVVGLWIGPERGVVESDWFIQFESLRNAVIRLPIAAGLSAILAFRPRRRGTPERQSTVVQTQIILSIVGAVVMLVVGASLARAFGIVGAAGLVRYRAKIADPKDAGVMLSTLAIGLACGVGLYFLALFAMLFVLGTVWLLESFEPEPFTTFELTVGIKDKEKDSKDLKPAIEHVLNRYRIPFELRTTSADDIAYEVKVPLKRHTDTISAAIVRVDPKHAIEVKWDKKKEKA